MKGTSRHSARRMKEDDSPVDDTWESIDVRYKKYWTDEKKKISQRIMPLIAASRDVWGLHDGSISRELSKEYTPNVDMRSIKSFSRSNTKGESTRAHKASHAQLPHNYSTSSVTQIQIKKVISLSKGIKSSFSIKVAEASGVHPIQGKAQASTFKDVYKQKKLRSKVFADFDIDEEKLDSMANNEEKRNLIVSTIFSRITNDLKNIVEENQKRSEKEKEEDLAARKKISNWESRDIFEWLHLPTSNINLRRLLRTKLVQLFTSVILFNKGRKL